VADGGVPLPARRSGLAAGRWRAYVLDRVVDRLGGDAAARCAAGLHVSSLPDDTAAK